MKFCNRCGSQLATTNEVELVKLFENRMDSEMEGLFWVTVLGLAAIFGGSAILKKIQLSEWIVVAYMVPAWCFSVILHLVYGRCGGSLGT
jgi:hypothetical protein